MQFKEHKFSARFPAVTCALFVIHEPAVKGVPYEGASGKTLYRGTAAAIILPDGRYWIGVCLCSPQDQFIKAVGRAKAIGRAYQKMKLSPSSFGDGVKNYVDPNYAAMNLRDRLRTAIDTMKREKGIL